MSPALIGLIYPCLVWCIHAVSPFALALTLFAPIACVYIAFLLAKDGRYRLALMVAYLGVGAPALYSFLGGWLDSQKWLPYRGNGVWVLLWCGLAVLTLFEDPREADVSTASMRLGIAHGISATVIAVFAAFHIANHVMGVFGGEVHIAVMTHLRPVYREPVVEVLLGFCILFQIVSGSILLLRRAQRPPVGWVEVLQNSSGAYMLVFFASHLSAVLRARFIHHIDTNWVWLTADNLLKDAWSTRLVPYYFIGVLALTVHGACGLRSVLLQHDQQKIGDRVLISALVGGALAALVIMIAMVLGSLSR